MNTSPAYTDKPYLNQIMSPTTRSHIFKFMYRFLNAPNNKDLYGKLTGKGDFLLKELSSVVDIVEERMYSVKDDCEKAIAEGLLTDHTWYRRHRKVEQ